MCAFIVMELLRITRRIHRKAVEQRATLIHGQYNRDWGTSYSGPPIDPYLTSPLLQNPGGATDVDDTTACAFAACHQHICRRAQFTQWQIPAEVDWLSGLYVLQKTRTRFGERGFSATVAQPPGTLFLPTSTTLQ